MTAHAGAAATAREARPDWRQSLTLTLISAAQLMFVLDATIINVALPAVQESLRLGGSELEWVVAAYSIAYGGLLMLGGRMGDVLGRRRMFLWGVALFTAASLLGGFATEAWQLTVMRALQGAGAAAASPAALSLIAVTFREGPQRGRAVGWYSAMATGGGGVGLLAGGLITASLSWRWVMFVNVPIGVLILAAGARTLREAPRYPGRFDAAGAATGTLAALLLTYGLIEGASDGGNWAEPQVLAALGGAVALFPVFLGIERRERQPLVPLRLFADRVRAASYLVSALTSMAMFGIFFFLTLFLQRVWGYGPLRTALVYLPLSVLLVLGARMSGRLMARLGPRALVCGGLLLAVAGMLWLVRIGDSGGYLTGMLVPTLLTYTGLGLVGVPLTLCALDGVPDRDTGAASSLNHMARQIGGATGLAVLGTVVWSSAGAASGGAVSSSALSSGVGHGFLAATAVTLLSLLLALLALPRRVRAA